MKLVRLSMIPLLAVALLSACDKAENVGPQLVDEENDVPASDCTPTSSDRIYVVNEGNFGTGNGSVSIYAHNSDELFDHAFQCINSIPLGDVPQSMQMADGSLFMIVNTSAVVQRVNPNTLEIEATINGFTSPRYMLPLSSTTALVTDLYASAIHIVDLNTNGIMGGIGVNGWVEHLLLHDGFVYAVGRDANQLYKIDASTLTLTDSLALTEDPSSIVLDANQHLWVLCSGGWQGNHNPALHRIDPATFTIDQSFVFPDQNDSPGGLTIDDNGQQLYFLNNDVFTMNISDTNLPTTAVVEANGRIFYALALHAPTQEIYVSDAIDYVQAGVVYRYNLNGDLQGQFNVGVNPGNFYYSP